MTDAEDQEESIPYFFGNDHPVLFTLQVFPHSAAVKDAAGAPWGCCVSPCGYTPNDDEQKSLPPVPIDSVARCEECFAYVSPFSDFTQSYWKCSLCGHMSRFTKDLARYRKKNAFTVLPELAQETVEFELPLDSKGAMMRSGEVLLEDGYLAKEPAAARPVVYLAVVDESAGPEYHDVMAEVLDTCVQALPDDCRFGVVTVSDRIGLVDLTAPLPHVQFVDLGLGQRKAGTRGDVGQVPRDGWPDPEGLVDLSSVMSLDELVCPLGKNRERVSANVKGLRRACRVGAGAPGQNGTRAAGLAVKLLLDLILGVTPGEGVGDKNASGSGNAAAAAGRRSGVGGNSNGTGYRRMAPAVERTRGFHFAGCRLMLFLGGAPDRGPGAVMVGVPSAAAVGGDADQDGNGAVHDQLFRGESRALGFYRGQAYRAASCGVSVDVHCFASKACEHFGLSSIAPLAMTTGGGLFRHSLLHQREGENRVATLAKEACIELLRPKVYDGLLRVRTSTEFNVNRDGVYGNLSADPRLENLWHVASCSSGQAFAMDFEFRGGGGGADLVWDADGDTSSTVQSAFAYTAVVPDTSIQDDGSWSNGNDHDDTNSGTGKNTARFVTVRRLRVSTVRTEASPKADVVATAADPAAVAAVLTHKVVSEARRSGFAEARALLRDWLVNFVYGLSQNLPPQERQGGTGSSADGAGEQRIKGMLGDHPLVVGVARQVFGLLLSPLLHPTRGIADARMSLLSRLTTLDAESLSIALYPEMQGYATPDIRLANSLSLSREAVKDASPACRIFVVDTFWRVVVHYVDSPASMAASTAAGETPLSFPPPPDSEIGLYLAMRRAVRPMAGQEIVYSRSGTPEEFFFDEALVEDRPLPKSDKEQTFKEFFSTVMKDATQEYE